MLLNKKGLFSIKLLSLFLPVLLVFGCAVQQKPQGGPRDRTPPKLLKATPLNKTRNFNTKEIKLDFDEFFKLNATYQEITITPTPDRVPDYKTRGKSLIIDLKDSLLKNTTYVINFGQAIKDVNEGNTLKNFTYVFSTGIHIDSLSISGSVTNALTQKSEVLANSENVTVMIFNLQQDSLLFGKKRPSVFTTVDSSGNFALNNLKEGYYKIYALREGSGADKIYNKDDELIGFTKTIHLQHDTTDVRLKLSRQIPPKFRINEKKFDVDGKMFFVFNKPLDKPVVRIVSPAGLDEQKIVDISKTRDTVMVYSRNMDFDAIKYAILDGDKVVDTLTLRKLRKESYTKGVTIRYGLSRFNTSLKPGTDLRLYTNIPIATINQDLITLMEDSTKVNFTIIKDTANAKNITVKYRWKQKSRYALSIGAGALTNIFGDVNKVQSVRFTLDNPDNYSTFTLKIKVPEPNKSYLIELLDQQKLVLRTDKLTANATLIYRNLYTGKFTVRVVYDDNKNGKYDPGSLTTNTQPENVWNYDKVFGIRLNLDVDETLEIPKEITSP